ncbi:MAG: reverse transcriptase domain-containing protein [Tenericutes bacterium]|nr:reverse transcriptase domain-containing protein [Mycoplasmatota bacterium]
MKKIIEGAYKKFKSKVYYDTNLILYKEKIAYFEANDFIIKINKLSNFVSENYDDEDYLTNLLSQISYIPMLKKVDNNKLHLNYIIDIPIELQVLDVLWTVYAAYSLEMNGYFSKHIYGNLIDNTNLFTKNENEDSLINWNNKSLFQKYIKGYNMWLGKAQKVIETSRYKEDHVTVVSSDFKRFYYSIVNAFDQLEALLINSDQTFVKLTAIIKEIHNRYRETLKNNCGLEIQSGSLPLGLSSSMLLSNIYLYKFDEYMANQEDVLFYGRYVDDMIIVLKKDIHDSDDDISAFNEYLSGCLEKTIGENNLKINRKKTKVFNFTLSSFISELDRFVLYFQHKEINYYSNEDEEEISYRRYISLGKKKLNSNMIDKGIIDEGKLLEVELIDAILFMNYIFTYIKFSSDVTSELLKKIELELKSNSRVSMWKEYYKWIDRFINDKDVMEKVYSKIDKNITELLKLDIEDVRYNQVEETKKMLKETYHKINKISLILSDSSISSQKNSFQNYYRSGMIVRKTPIRYFIENIKTANNMRNSSSFYRDLYNNTVPFISLWEILMYDQLVNIIFKKKKTIKQSIMTFMSINEIEQFDYIDVYAESKIKGVQVSQFNIHYFDKENTDYIISHPNLCLDNKPDEPLKSWKYAPRFGESARIINNIIEANKNKTDMLVLPELYVFFEWLHFIGYTAQLFEMNVVMGLRNIIVKNKYYNIISAMYNFRDAYKHRNLFVTAREKNFYAYDEHEWCKNNYHECKDALIPKYFSVTINEITYSDYMCYEVTDIFSRAIFKGEVDVIVIPMLNRDTSYFDAIIHSLSRDLSCCVVTSNSASWGNSSIILPKNTAGKVFTEFKGGFNQYLVSSKVPIYQLIDFNTTFETPDKENDPFKPHSANFNYKKRIDQINFD